MSAAQPPARPAAGVNHWPWRLLQKHSTAQVQQHQPLRQEGGDNRWSCIFYALFCSDKTHLLPLSYVRPR